MPEDMIKGYRIERLIGAGGMGMVYLGTHEALGRQAAIKVLLENLSAQPHVRERFIQEARLMAGLNHPNIVALYDFATEPRFSLIMEYIEGRGLDLMIGQEVGPIPYEKALPLFVQILSGIGYAHEQGIIHRDIKPSNVLVSREGNVKVTDLGIAKIAGQKGMTKTGAQMGTLYYESPEQVRGARDVDQRSDIYSLGMTLYEMLAGRLPFETDGTTSEYAIMDSIVKREEHLDPRDYYPHIPDWLVKVVQKATDLEPEKRFQSCSELLDAITEQWKSTRQTTDFWIQRVAEAPATELPLSTSSVIMKHGSISNASRFCTACGESISDSVNHCPNCGARQVDEVAPVPMGPGGGSPSVPSQPERLPVYPTNRSKGAKWWLVFPIAGLVILILAVIAIPKFASIEDEAKKSACRSNMKNLATAQAMYYARLNHVYADAYGLESSEIMGNAASLTCPADDSPYDYFLDPTPGSESYTITCTNSGDSHGSVTDGVTSWQGETL